ncbi:MAG: Gldg family protein [Isosphaeraceae bacterium]
MLVNLFNLLALPGVWIAAAALASYLILFWTLRGSPPGQSPPAEDDPGAPRRRWRDWIIAGITLGLTLILVGGYLAFTHGILWAIPVLGVGVGLVLYLNVMIQPYRHTSPILRRTSVFSGLFLNAALFGGILMVANVLAFRYGGWGIDLTREQTFSLASRTLKQLQSLDRPVTFHLLFGRGPRSVPKFDRVVQLLELYAAARPDQIKIDSINPYTELTRGEELRKHAPDLAVVQGDRVLIEYGEGKEAQYMVVPGNEMFAPIPPDVSRRGPDRFESVFKGEDAITSALIRLREGKKSKVAFTTGHGEPSTADVNPSSREGIGIWRARLAAIGCEPVDLNLLRDSIPDDLTLLCIVGPKQPFKPEEVAKLKLYTDKGGPVLLLLGNTEPSGLDEFLKSFNLEIGRGLVIDPQANFNGNLQLVYTFLKQDQGHPITDAMQLERPVLIPNGAPIRVLGLAPPPAGKTAAEPVNANLVPTIILHSGPQSWAETDLTNRRPRFDRGTDQQGPIPVGVAVQERAADGDNPKPRLVLFSSSALANNIVQGLEPTNLDLVMNAASWLRGRPDTVGIAASTHVALTLTADPLLRNRLVLVPTVMATLSIIAAGLIVYVARRE